MRSFLLGGVLFVVSGVTLWSQTPTTTMVSGNNQTGQIGTQLANPFVVRVTDATGSPVQGLNVGFIVSSTPGNQTGAGLTAANVLSDANGIASSSLVLGVKIGVYTVVAFASGYGSPVPFTATALAGSPAQLLKVSGDNQIAPVSSPLGAPLVIQVADVGGNPVPGITVSYSFFSTPFGASGYFLNPASGISNFQGFVSSAVRLGNLSGQYRVTVTSPFIGGVFAIFSADAFTPTAVENGAGVPSSFSLYQNYPNPFNPATTVRFDLPEQSSVTIEVSTILGARVEQIVTGEWSAGHHEILWRANDYPSGVYIIRMKALSTVSSRIFFSEIKSVLLK